MNSLTDWLMGYQQTGLTTRQRATHTYVVGQSGTGKSRALESWIMQDVRANRGVGVIDPHGDLFNNLLARIADLPDLADRVVLFDPLDPDWVIGFNPLEAAEGYSQERLALYLTDVVIKVWKLKPEEAPRMVWLLANSFLALIDLKLTLLDLPRWLIDLDFRDSLIPRLSNVSVARYFTEEYPHSQSGMHQWATPVLNKLGHLIFDPDVRLLFSSRSTIDFRQLMDERKVLLVNLPKGILGESLSSLLAAFIVAHLQKAALARADAVSRPPFYLYLDEFQNYTTDNIQDILSESRKYALSLTLAHQYLKQLPDQLRSAVLNTAGTLVSFRVGYRDGLELAKEIFPRPDFLEPAKLDIRLSPHLMPVRVSQRRQAESGWDVLARELTGLENRHFWARKRGVYDPVKQSSFWVPDPQYSSEKSRRIQALRQASGLRYARKKSEFEFQPQSQSVFEEPLPYWGD